LQLLIGLPELLRASAQVRDLHDVPVLRDGRNFQNVRDGELSGAVLGILLDELVQDVPGLGAEMVEKVLALPLEPVGPFPPGPLRRIEREVAEQVERIRVRLPGGQREFLKLDTSFAESLDDLRPLLRVPPVLPELRGVGVKRSDLLRCVRSSLRLLSVERISSACSGSTQKTMATSFGRTYFRQVSASVIIWPSRYDEARSTPWCPLRPSHRGPVDGTRSCPLGRNMREDRNLGGRVSMTGPEEGRAA